MNAGLPLHPLLNRHENDCHQVNPGNAILCTVGDGAWTCPSAPACQWADCHRFT